MLCTVNDIKLLKSVYNLICWNTYSDLAYGSWNRKIHFTVNIENKECRL